jgi:hypothetical protein
VGVASDGRLAASFLPTAEGVVIMWRNKLVKWTATLSLLALVGVVAAAPPRPGVRPKAVVGGYAQAIHNLVDDGQGHVSFTADFDGNAFGFSQDGTITCSGKILDSSVQNRPGMGGNFTGTVNGKIYQWNANAGNFQGVHVAVNLTYEVQR